LRRTKVESSLISSRRKRLFQLRKLKADHSKRTMIARLPLGFLPSPTLRKNKWTMEEDVQLRHAVHCSGTNSWHEIAMFVPTRTGKQCRERWLSQLSPAVVKDFWLPEEDAILLQGHATLGNRWTTIAAQLPGRSALSVKNRWHWLSRHRTLADQGSGRAPAPRPFDFVESATRELPTFDSLAANDCLFGAGFEEFQAKMLG
jgi:hypothetical protein